MQTCTPIWIHLIPLHTLTQDAPEFSLQSVQQKLGQFTSVEDPATANGAANADAMPSQQTLKMNYQREYQSGSVATAKR